MAARPHLPPFGMKVGPSSRASYRIPGTNLLMERAAKPRIRTRQPVAIPYAGTKKRHGKSRRRHAPEVHPRRGSTSSGKGKQRTAISMRTLEPAGERVGSCIATSPWKRRERGWSRTITIGVWRRSVPNLFRGASSGSISPSDAMTTRSSPLMSPRHTERRPRRSLRWPSSTCRFVRASTR